MRSPLDISDEDIAPPAKRGKPQKDPEELLRDEQYYRRCRLVTLSHSDYDQFLQYLTENESFFRSMPAVDKECLRRTCDRACAGSRFATMDDIRTFDKIFGPLIDVRRSYTIPVVRDGVHINKKTDPYELPIEQQIAWFSDCPYDNFWDWISNAETQRLLSERKDLRYRVEMCIDENRRHDFEFIKHRKRYDPGDEDLFSKVLGMMA